uniref:(northern house mosquito) hypothetical protein n=1 Tax=Culex pipiens TaxID=7175 RepID=A0A8D8G9J7_CULPI
MRSNWAVHGQFRYWFRRWFRNVGRQNSNVFVNNEYEHCDRNNTEHRNPRNLRRGAGKVLSTRRLSMRLAIPARCRCETTCSWTGSLWRVSMASSVAGTRRHLRRFRRFD